MTPDNRTPAVHHHPVHDLFGGTVFAVVGAKAAASGLDLATVAATIAAVGMFLNGLANAIRMGLEAYRAAISKGPSQAPEVTK